MNGAVMDQTQKRNLNSRARIGADRIKLALSNFVDAVAKAEGIKINFRNNPRKRQLLTTKQAARLIGMAPKTLANWRYLGSGPAFQKVGGKCLYRRKDLLLFDKNRKFQFVPYFDSEHNPKNGGQS
jgi:hypothetical protein